MKPVEQLKNKSEYTKDKINKLETKNKKIY
jgi:hypothetical protein